MKNQKINNKLILYLIFATVLTVKIFLIINFEGISSKQLSSFNKVSNQEFTKNISHYLFKSQSFFGLITFIKINLIIWTALSTSLLFTIFRLAKFTSLSSIIGVLFFNFSFYWLIQETGLMEYKIKIAIFTLQLMTFFLFLKQWRSTQKLHLLTLFNSFLLGISGIFAPELIIHSFAPIIAISLIAYRNGDLKKSILKLSWLLFGSGLLISFINWTFLITPHYDHSFFSFANIIESLSQFINYDYENINGSTNFPILPSAISISTLLGLILVIIEAHSILSIKRIKTYITGSFSVLILTSLIFILISLFIIPSHPPSSLYILVTLLMIISVYPLDHLKRTYQKIKNSSRNYLKIRRANVTRLTLAIFSTILLVEVYFQWQFFNFDWSARPKSKRYLNQNKIALAKQLKSSKKNIILVYDPINITINEIAETLYLIHQMTDNQLIPTSKIDFFNNKQCGEDLIVLHQASPMLINSAQLKCPELSNQKLIDDFTIIYFKDTLLN